MPRTVVPSRPAKYFDGEQAQAGDTTAEKLVKYVPGETLAFFVPVAAALGTTHNGVLIAAMVAGAVGSVGYLWLNARKLKKSEQPLLHYYPLSIVAFIAWAIGTTPSVMKLVGIDDVAAGVVLACAVFLVPLADGILNELQV